MAGWMSAVDQKSVAYAMTSLGSSMMNSVFMFYYVKVYLHLFHVSQPWFQSAQVVFMIWNTLNDPLFGYVQDNYNFAGVKTRRHSILYGALPYVVAFLLPWFAWSDYSQPSLLAGVQLLVVLCLYDALYTFVLLAQSALFTEMSRRHEDRLRLIRYSQVASVLGSTTVFFCNLFSNNLSDYRAFQICCLVIAVLALLCMLYTGKYAQTLSVVSTNKHSEYSYWRQTFQIFTHQSFISFVLVNFLQIFHSVFLSNFTGIICDELISEENMSPATRSTFYGSLFLLPQVLVIMGTPALRHFGYYQVIRASFILKMLLGCMLYVTGSRWWYLVIHFLLDNFGAKATFSLFNLPLSDIIDTDKEKYQRRHPLSSMVYGTNALVTKPAVSLAPMIISAVLTGYGYQQKKQSGTQQSEHELLPTDGGDGASLHEAMFLIACVVPVVVGALQLLLWSLYTIRNSHQAAAATKKNVSCDE